MTRCERGLGRWDYWLASAAVAGAAIFTANGCATPWLGRAKDPAEIKQDRLNEVKDLWESDRRPRTLSEIGRKVLSGTRVENVAIVNGLPGTGGKVEASTQRDHLLDIMRQRNVPNPNQMLDDPSTAMVVAQVLVPPAAQKNDRLNVLVKVSNHAEATNLQSGWLMRSELVEMKVLGGQLKQGFGYAMVQGPLVTEQQISGADTPEAAKAAMVVGGAVLMQSRNIGIAIEERFAHAVTMSKILPVINKRFTVFDGSKQVGVAKPRQENYIELTVPARYRKDPNHFASVVLHFGIAEGAADMRARLDQCRLELSEPTTAKRAAWQLEAIGKEAIPVLAEALQHPDKEVRFYAAHALGYLNDPRAVPVLRDLAASEPAFRAMCLNSLSVIENYQASDALEELLHSSDPEARYGALLALRDNDESSPLTRGEHIGDVGTIVEIPSSGAPQVVVGLNKTPEIVIFGVNPPVNFSAFVYVNPRLMLRKAPGGRIAVSHIVPGRDDRLAECSADLRSLLAAIAEVGGNYGDWVNFVRVCGVDKHIAAAVAINPVPDSGRTFHRDGDPDREPGDLPLDESVEEVLAAPTTAADESSQGKSQWLNPLSWFDK